MLHFDPFPASFHGFSTIPAHVNPAEHLGIALAAFLLCALAALVPAFPASRSDAGEIAAQPVMSRPGEFR